MAGDGEPEMKEETCEAPGCQKKFTFATTTEYIELMKSHNLLVHAVAGDGSAEKTSVKLPRPELQAEGSAEEWSYFLSRWEAYKKTLKVTTEEQFVAHLLACTSDTVRRDHFRRFHGEGEQTVKNILKQLKEVATKCQNVAVTRMQLGALKQEAAEPVRRFAGRVKSLAMVAEFSVKCGKPCCDGAEVDYYEEMITDQVIRGLYNQEILKDVLSSKKMNMDDLLVFVEGRESGSESQGILAGPSVTAAVDHNGSGGGDRGRRGARGGGRGGQAGGRGRGKYSFPRQRGGGGQAEGGQGKQGDGNGGKEDITCFNCGGKGHTKWKCPSKPQKPKTLNVEEQKADSGDESMNEMKYFYENSVFANKPFVYDCVSIGKEAVLPSPAQGKPCGFIGSGSRPISDKSIGANLKNSKRILDPT